MDGKHPLALRAVLGLFTLVMGGTWLAIAVFGPGFAARTQPTLPAGIDLAAALAPTQAAYWVPVLMLAVIGALLYGHLRKPHAAWGLAIVAVLATDLWTFWQVQGLAFVLPRTATAATLPPMAFPARLPDMARGRSLTLPAARYPNCYDCDLLALLIAYRYPGTSIVQGEATINGYDAFVPARYGQVLGMDSFGVAGEHAPTLFDDGHHALDLLGLRTLRIAPELVAGRAWQTRLPKTRWRPMPDEGGLRVFTNPRALPAAWRPTRAVMATPASVAGRLTQPDFDPAAEALVEGALATPTASAGEATVVLTSLNTMRATTTGADAGLLAIAMGYDDGWRAQLAGSGEPVPVYRLDGLVMAVPVPAGTVTVELAYVPRLWAAGTMASGASLLLLGLGAWAWSRRWRW